jgi:hypothetical protein
MGEDEKSLWQAYFDENPWPLDALLDSSAYSASFLHLLACGGRQKPFRQFRIQYGQSQSKSELKKAALQRMGGLTG